MKKLAILTAILFALTSYSAIKPRIIMVEGNFLHDKNIKFTLYQVDSLGKYIELESSEAKKTYYVKCYTKTKYVLKFESKNKVKYMEFEIKIHKNVQVDVDFNTDDNIHMEYSGNGLIIKKLNPTEIAIK